MLRHSLPTTFDASLQPRVRDYQELTKVDTEAQKKQWRSSLAKFTRLVWSLDWERALKTLVSQPQHVALFGKWLSTEAPTDAMQLELMVLSSELQKQPAAAQGAHGLDRMRPGIRPLAGSTFGCA